MQTQNILSRTNFDVIRVIVNSSLNQRRMQSSRAVWWCNYVHTGHTFTLFTFALRNVSIIINYYCLAVAHLQLFNFAFGIGRLLLLLLLGRHQQNPSALRVCQKLTNEKKANECEWKGYQVNPVIESFNSCIIFIINTEMISYRQASFPFII